MAKERPEGCGFCAIVLGTTSAWLVDEDEHSVAFLDHRPLFPGHVLVVPKEHHETLVDLPASLLSPVMSMAQRIARAVEVGLDVDGSFVAMNNRVSQSVPHLHVHVVPRRRKDGLRGFFWPRTKYPNDEAALSVVAALRGAIARSPVG
jgi:histidine triad (HIT) family protein